MSDIHGGRPSPPLDENDGCNGEHSSTVAAPVSCNPCRARKKKCDREKPCKPCLARGEECVYSEPSRRGPSAGWASTCLERALECEAALAAIASLPGVRHALQQEIRDGCNLDLVIPPIHASRDAGHLTEVWQSMPLETYRQVLDFAASRAPVPAETVHGRSATVQPQLHPIHDSRVGPPGHTGPTTMSLPSGPRWALHGTGSYSGATQPVAPASSRTPPPAAQTVYTSSANADIDHEDDFW